MNELDEKLYAIIRSYGEQVDPQGYEDGDVDSAVTKLKQVFAFYGLSEAMPYQPKGSTIEDKLKELIGNSVDEYGEIDPQLIPKLQAIITTETTKARKQAASDIFTLAHEYAQNDDTMVGSEELRGYHYYNALHKIGGFSGR